MQYGMIIILILILQLGAHRDPDSYGSRAYLDEDKTKRTRSRLHASRARARTLISCFHLTSARRMALSRVAVGQPPP